MANNPNASPLERVVLDAVERLLVKDHQKAAVGWTRDEIKASFMQTGTRLILIEELPHVQDVDGALQEELVRLVLMGDLKVHVGVGGQPPYHYTLPPPYLPCFRPHVILEAVEQLVAKDHHKAAVGWTFEDIKVSLVQTHTHQQQEIEKLALSQHFFVDTLRAELARLVQMGDLKVLAGDGRQQHYTLSAPYLPPWFCPRTVLQAVEEVNKENTGGWTWEQMKDFLMRTHHQQLPPLPPDLDTVLRTMVSVLRQRGHLTDSRVAIDDGPRHYTRRQAPALVEPNPIRIPDHLWCYYLGYKLAAGDGLDGSDPGEKISDEDAFVVNNLKNNPNAPPWFGPQTVLKEVERLCLHDFNNATVGGGGGWTVQDIRESLMREHHEEQLPPGFGAMLRATLATLSKRGYLKTTRVSSQPRYTLSNTPPAYFPWWFSSWAVLNAVKELDDKYFAGGSTWGHIKGYFITKHGHTHLPYFDRMLRTMLSVLRQRGLLTSGATPEHYTWRHATAICHIDGDDNDGDNLLWYYIGYKLGGSCGCLDDGVELSPPTAQAGISSDVVRGIRQRHATNISTDTQPLLLPSRDDDETSRSTSLAIHIHGDERITDEPRRKEKKRKEKRKRQRKKYMIWRLWLSLFDHGILYTLTFIPGFGEEINGHHGEEPSIKWLKWTVMNVIAPLVLLIVMIIIQKFFVINLENIPRNKVKRCEIVNLSMISCSKIAYVSIKEAPGPKVTLLHVIVHVIAFVFEMSGALYLWWDHSFLDQEMPVESWLP